MTNESIQPDMVVSSAPSPAEKCKCGHTQDWHRPHCLWLHTSATRACECQEFQVPEPVSTEGAAGLLPCPFCGKQPASRWLGANYSEDNDYWGIDCCNAYAHADSEEEAAEQWNRRVTAPIAPAAVRCQYCGWPTQPSAEGDGTGTLDVERAEQWMIANGYKDQHWAVSHRWLAELLHDYSLSLLPAPPLGQGKKR